MNEFQARHVEKVTGVKQMRLYQWLDRGYITPSIQQTSNTGVRNIYSLEDLYHIALFKKLVESGLSRSVTAKQISQFRQTFSFNEIKTSLKDNKRFTYMNVARSFDDDNVNVGFGYYDKKERPGELETITTKFFGDGFDQVIFFNIEKIITEVDEKVAEITD